VNAIDVINWLHHEEKAREQEYFRLAMAKDRNSDEARCRCETIRAAVKLTETAVNLVEAVYSDAHANEYLRAFDKAVAGLVKAVALVPWDPRQGDPMSKYVDCLAEQERVN
jgi:hypothetical protein